MTPPLAWGGRAGALASSESEPRVGSSAKSLAECMLRYREMLLLEVLGRQASRRGRVFAMQMRKEMIARSRNPAEPLVSVQGDPGKPWDASGEQSCPYAVLFPLQNYTRLYSPMFPSRATLLTCNGFLTLQLGNKSLVLVADFSVTPYGSTFVFPALWGRTGLDVVAEILSLLLCSCRKSYPNAWGGPKGSSLCLEAQGDFHLLLYAEGCTERELRQLWGLPSLRG